MIQPQICIPVIDRTIAAVKKTIQEIEEYADYIEMRVDYIEGVAVHDVETLRALTKKPVIFTCRSQKENGEFTGSEEERRTLLHKALESGFEFVDIELETMNEHAFQSSLTSKIIVSYHNFEDTPHYWDLTKIIDEMSSYSPDVYKIATMVKTEKDIEALFRLLATKQGKTMIVVGMGDHGKIVRVISPYLGNMFTFASYKKGSAPGQIQVKDLQNVYKLIKETI